MRHTLSKDMNQKAKSPGETILKILCFTLLIAIVIVSHSGPALQKLDLWMDNINHQLYTLIAVTVITFISWLWWRAKR